MKASLLPKEGEAALPLLNQQQEDTLYEGDKGPPLPATVKLSTCTLRKSRLSLSSLSSKSKVQVNEGLDSGLECEDDTIPRVVISVKTQAADIVPPHIFAAADARSDAVPPADVNPRISIDSGCYDYETEADLRRMPQHCLLQGSRQEDNLQCPRSPSANSSKGAGVQSAKDSSDLEPLFTNWKPSMNQSRVSPAMQRPMTMGGVYSTGHHLQHHRNRSHGNNHRGSLTSYGTGTSTRTSARTSRSTSQQTGSISCDSGMAGSVAMESSSGVIGSMGCGSGVFGTAARQSKTPSQSQEANKPTHNQ